MATADLLIDTSIFIEHLRKQNRQKTILYNIVGDYAIYTSTVVEFELYAGATDSQKRHDVQAILSWSTVLPLTSDVAQRAAAIFQQLRATNQLIEMRDILIAATAIAHSLPLMTLNVGHFERMDTLQLVALPEI
ncbi:MAG TPA: type II toxin-antitoxin system VapC family toxin [Caldilineaceae bacterium]|nr:type II toxin-antitoxin system VapC family toxin [Caldilineaceae bacterium]